MRFVLACGGSGGHINPALAVGERLRDGGHEVLFVGAPQGLEKVLVPRENFPLKFVNVRSLSHKLTPKAMIHNMKVAAGMLGSLRQAKKILAEFAPDAVLGTGGYASYPTLRAAAKMGIPTVVHESNAIPGVTTKLLAGDARWVLVSMESARKSYGNPDKVRVVGTPVRGHFGTSNRMLARERLGLDNRPLVVSLFGSQGAGDMNRMMLRLMTMEQEADKWQHIHATGKAAFERSEALAASLGIDFKRHCGLRLTEYIYDMPDMLAGADLVICRAGFSTLAELMFTGCPAILIPSPNVAADHQTQNAKALADLGAAKMIPEEGLDAETLFAEIEALLNDAPRRDAMTKALKNACVPNSAEQIRDILIDCGSGK